MAPFAPWSRVPKGPRPKSRRVLPLSIADPRAVRQRTNGERGVSRRLGSQQADEIFHHHIIIDVITALNGSVSLGSVTPSGFLGWRPESTFAWRWVAACTTHVGSSRPNGGLTRMRHRPHNLSRKRKGFVQGPAGFDRAAVHAQ